MSGGGGGRFGFRLPFTPTPMNYAHEPLAFQRAFYLTTSYAAVAFTPARTQGLHDTQKKHSLLPAMNAEDKPSTLSPRLTQTLPIGASPLIKSGAEMAVYVRHRYLAAKIERYPGRYPHLSKELEALRPLMLSIATRIPRGATVSPDTSKTRCGVSSSAPNAGSAR